MISGIIRKMDDLGRIAIPKEIRKSLRIKEGTPLECRIANGSLIVTPYNPEDSARIIGGQFMSALEDVSGITNEDKDTIWAIINKIK